MKTAVERIKEFRYELRAFGIEIDSSVGVFCDIKSVTKDTTNAESTLSKKHNVIAYHLCQEAVVAGTIRVAKEDTTTIFSDLLINAMAKERREDLMFKFMYELFMYGLR